jgi:hypothetical protein
LVEAAEGAGYWWAAATVGVPASTVRGWLTSVRTRSATLVAGAIEVIRAAGEDVWARGRPPVWAGRALPEAVTALAGAARALHAGFGMIDPTELLADLRGRPLINVLTRARLLTPSPDG